MQVNVNLIEYIYVQYIHKQNPVVGTPEYYHLNSNFHNKRRKNPTIYGGGKMRISEV